MTRYDARTSRSASPWPRLAVFILATLGFVLIAGCTPGDEVAEDGPPETPAPEPEPEPERETTVPDRETTEDERIVEDPEDATRLAHGTELRRAHVGLPEGWSGTPSGPVVSEYDGQIIEGLEIDASGVQEAAAIDVVHDDVLVRHVRVHHRDGRNGIRFESSTTGGRVEFSEFYGHYREEPHGNFGSIGVVGEGPVDVYRNYFQGGRDGVRIDRGPAKIYENWVEDLHYHPEAHNDGFAHMGGNDAGHEIRFARNRTVDGNSGGIDLYALRGPVQEVTIVDNLVVGGRKGFGIYGGGALGYHEANRSVRIEGNRFEGEFAHSGAVGDGTNAGVDLSRPGNTFEDNTWVGSDEPLPARCGVDRDDCG